VLAEPETGGGSKMGFGRMEYYPMDLDRSPLSNPFT